MSQRSNGGGAAAGENPIRIRSGVDGHEEEHEAFVVEQEEEHEACMVGREEHNRTRM